MSFKHILIAVDGEALSVRAASIGVAISLGPLCRDDRTHRADLGRTSAALAFNRLDYAAQVIASGADGWPAVLLITGSQGREGFGRGLLGRVAEAVARHAPDPVLVTPSLG
jgi:nucleotide-binding universal stress UspA family protein